MPSGTITIGEIQITALCDVVSEPWPLSDAFPGVPVEEWPAGRERYPDTVGSGGRWRYRNHCFLVRAGETVIVLDTGIGPAGTPIAEEIHKPGGVLPDELRAVGVAPDDVAMVVISHMHFDHIGWNLGDGTKPVPRFPRARYLVQQAEWEAYEREPESESRGERRRLVESLRDLSVLELVGGRRTLADGLEILPTPGHTPGSQSLLVTSPEKRALVCGDVANHPVQVPNPGWRSMADADPEAAAATRHDVFGEAERDGTVIAPAHFPEPFGHIALVEGRRQWHPIGGHSTP